MGTFQQILQNHATPLAAGGQRKMVAVLRLLPALQLQRILQFMPNGYGYPQGQWSGSTTTTPPSTYEIGDPGPSCVGKVFYITDGGLHGLEAAPPSWYDPYADSPDPELVWISGDPYR